MRALNASIVVALAGLCLAAAACKGKRSSPAATGSGSAADTPPELPEAPPVASADASAPSPEPDVPVQTTSAVCCCESTGATARVSLEADRTACERPERSGKCVGHEQCGFTGSPRVLKPDEEVEHRWFRDETFPAGAKLPDGSTSPQPVEKRVDLLVPADVDGAAMPVVWMPTPSKAVAVEVKRQKLGAKQAEIRVSSDGEWQSVGKLKVATNLVVRQDPSDGSLHVESIKPGDPDDVVSSCNIQVDSLSSAIRAQCE